VLCPNEQASSKEYHTGRTDWLFRAQHLLNAEAVTETASRGLTRPKKRMNRLGLPTGDMLLSKVSAAEQECRRRTTEVEAECW
jgi:hypothetical protein